MVRIIFSIFLLGITSGLVAQRRGKSFFLELAGNGGFVSVNFDSRFKKSEKGPGYRVGFGLIPPSVSFFISTPTIWTVPIGVNYLIGGGRHYFEPGLGVTYFFFSGTTSDFWGINEKDKGSGILFVPSAGYRYAPPGKAFQGRIFVSPVINSEGANFWWGLSTGIKF